MFIVQGVSKGLYTLQAELYIFSHLLPLVISLFLIVLFTSIYYYPSKLTHLISYDYIKDFSACFHF